MGTVSFGHHISTENIDAVNEQKSHHIHVHVFYTETHYWLYFYVPVIDSVDNIQLWNGVLQQIIIPSHLKIELNQQ